MGRPLRGSRLASFHTSDTDTDPIAPPSLSTLDSAFQLQEYIGAVVRLNPHDIERIVKVPGRNANADGDEKEKEVEGEDEKVSVDEACWIYEQLRRLAQDLTHPLITMLQQECTRQTCPEMKAGEWLYLCVAHGNSGAMEHCCAIDYIVHTLDSATALLNSPRAFPSRIAIPQTSHRHFPSLARRLGRIFAHAYHHHRLAFESAEAESALYARFLALSRHFDLVPAEFLVIPERNEQGETDIGRGSGDMDRKNVTLLTRGPDSITSPAPTIPTTSPSPRIGGRARTDTMYLSGGYGSPHNRGSPGVSPSRSPRRIPSPMTATLPGVASQDGETLIASEKDAMDEDATAQEGTEGVPTPEGKTPADGQAPDAKEIPLPPLRVPGQVLARDFALKAPLPVAFRAPVGTDADATNASIEDISSQAKDVDAEMERDEASSDPESLEEDGGTTSSTPDQLSTVPSDAADPIPAPPYSEVAPAEPPLPAVASHMPEAEPELFVEVENVAAPEPDPDPVIIPDELKTDDDGTDVGPLDEENGVDEAKEEEEEILAEITPSSVLDAQQEPEETSVDENTEKSLQSEDA